MFGEYVRHRAIYGAKGEHEAHANAQNMTKLETYKRFGLLNMRQYFVQSGRICNSGFLPNQP